MTCPNAGTLNELTLAKIEKKIEGLGGKTVLKKKAESEHGYYANYKDPEGNRFGVYETRQK